MLVPLTLNVICVAYKRTLPLKILINAFLNQSDPRWRLFIIHDGPASEDLHQMLAQHKDVRILYQQTETLNGSWGHPNRRAMLGKMPFNHRDFVLITNDDNYYVPTFVEVMLKHAGKRANPVGMVFCDTLHNYTGYEVLHTSIRRGRVDMGSFIVRNDVAKKVGFNFDDFDADGIYAEQCSAYCRRYKIGVVYVPKCLFVHN